MEGYSPVSPKAVPTSPCGVDSRATSLTSDQICVQICVGMQSDGTDRR